MYKLTEIFYLPSRGGCHVVDFLCKLLRLYGNEKMFSLKGVTAELYKFVFINVQEFFVRLYATFSKKMKT